MDEFCGSQFWDLNVTWHTSNPDFTQCFQGTVLTWFPVLFMWIFAIVDIHMSNQSSAKNIPRGVLNVTKIILTILLIIIQILKLSDIIAQSKNNSNSNQTILFENNGSEIEENETLQGEQIFIDLNYPVYYTSPLLIISAYVIYLGTLHYSLTRGTQSSGVQFFFWFFLLISESIKMRSFFINVNKETSHFTYALIVINLPLIIGQFILNCWADLKPSYIETGYTSQRDPCPEKSSSFLNRILFGWFDKLIITGFKRPLVDTDLFELNFEDQTRSLVPLFEKYWSAENFKEQPSYNNETLYKDKKAKFNKQNGSIELKGSSQRSQKEAKGVMTVLFKCLGSTFVTGSLIFLVPTCLQFVSPQILNLLIGFVGDEYEENQHLWKGYFYAIFLFITAVAQTIFSAQYSHRMYLTGLRIRTGLTSAIYRKSLRISNAARKETTVGEVVNLMSVDTQRLMELIIYINMAFSAPLSIGLAMYFLFQILGVFVLAGLAIMVLSIPLNAFIAGKARKFQMEQMKYKDKRVKLMNEILNGIKVLKLYSWEPSFEDQILVLRSKEISVLKKAAYLNSFVNFFWTCSPFLVCLTTFGTYVFWDENNVLDPQTAFVSLSLFNLLSMPLTFVPMLIMSAVQAMVSVRRLNKYMNYEEINTETVEHNPNESDPIVIENGYFTWNPKEEDRVTLKNINIRIKKGSLVAIVGQVGVGKSSLLLSMFGEMEKISGRINTIGSIAYASQQSWIQNATLKDNILFGKNMDFSRYNKIIEACALKTDLEILPGGDKTEIGEKGINLSGGQKSRVSLARAVYNNADLYLLDDSLAAVDAHVGKHIFDKVIGPNGLLKKKTRVFVTHGISYLNQTDQIIVVKDGMISEFGNFEELMTQKGAFSEFLSQHLTHENGGENGVKALSVEELQRQISQLSESRFESSTEQDSDATRKSSIDATHSLKKRLSKESNNKLIEVEKTETAGVKWQVYIEYFKAAGIGVSLLTLLFYLVFQGFAVSANLWLAAWSNEPPTVNGTQDASTRDLYLGVYGILGFMQAICILLGTITLAFGSLRSAAVLHHRMLARILKAPLSFFDSTPIGRILNRFSKDVDVADSMLPFNIRLWMNSFFQVVSIFAIIGYTTPTFLLLIIPIGIVYYFIQKVYVSTSRQLKRMESTTRSPIYSHFSETLNGISTIRAYKLQNKFIDDSDSKIDYNQISYFPAIVANRWLSVRLETLGNTIVFFAALFVVIERESINPGLVGLSVSYALQITMAMNLLVRWTSDVETNIVAVERLNEYSGIAQERPREVKEHTPEINWPTGGGISFEKYQTRYREGLDLVLKDVTCKINPGEKIGICGRTGAGKSSLALALFRIVEPTGGTIVVDGADIIKMGLHDVRGRLAIIPQDPVLFSGSLRMNLDPFNKFGDNEIWNVLEMAHLKSFVQDLPSKLEYQISEGGDNLSTGQKQLVCLARSLLRKAKILVLDEATAAVDLDTDDLIQKTIREEFKDSTVLTIAHRLNTIMDYDRIMVLDQGKIAELDTPDNLLKSTDSIFFSLAKEAGLV